MAEAARSRRHGEKMRLILLFSLSRRAFDPVSHPARTRERERAFLGTRERTSRYGLSPTGGRRREGACGIFEGGGWRRMLIDSPGE